MKPFSGLHAFGAIRIRKTAILAVLLCVPSLGFAQSVSGVNPAFGHPGDVVTLSGSGFASNDVVRFGPNQAPVLTATGSDLTVQVPNGQPLGPTLVSVNGNNGPTFHTVANAKIANVPPNPAVACGTSQCPCPTCGCQEPQSSPCVSQSTRLGGTPGGSNYGERGEFFQPATDLAIPGVPGADPLVQFSLTRMYRSASDASGPQGSKWDQGYFEHLTVEPDGSIMDSNNGRNDRYLLNNMGNYVAPPELFTQLVKNGDGSYTLTYKNRTVKSFNSEGEITSISDRNGDSIALAYNGQGQLTAVTDTLGRPITYTYNSSGRLTEVTDYNGRTVTYTYDSNGNLTSVTTPAVTGTPNGNNFPSGKTTRYTYDYAGRLLTMIRPNEVADSGPPVLRNTYDSQGRLATQYYGGLNGSYHMAGGTYTFTYAPENQSTVSDDPNLPVMVTTQTDPNGNVTRYTYNRLGYPLTLVDAGGFTTTYTYNADGRLSSMTLPKGNAFEYTYDAGNTSRYSEGNLLQQTETPGSRGGDQTFITTTYTYEPIYNHIATVTEPRGNDPSYVPQNGGSQSAARYTTTYTYDSSGNLIEMVQPSVALPGGLGEQSIVTNYTYNSFGQLTSSTDPEGNVTQYQYCPQATPSCATPSSAGGGYLQETITDATTSSRRTESTPPAAIVNQYFYDTVGNMTRMIDGRGNDTLYTYNQLNQVVETQSEAPYRYTTYTFYDANDNVIQRNVENQVPTTTNGKPNFTSGGNYSSTDGTPAYFMAYYTYDILDKLVLDNEDATGSTPARVKTQYYYDADQNRIQVTLPAGNINRFAYDSRNLLASETSGFGSSAASTTSYSYDGNRNCIEMTNGRGNMTTYQYDGFDRRTTVTDAITDETQTHYDPASNGIGQYYYGSPGGTGSNTLLKYQSSEYDEMSRAYQVDDQPVDGSSFVASGVSTARPVSESVGPLKPGAISSQTIYDRNGRIVQQIDDDLTTTTTQYDGVNRIVRVTDPQGNTTTSTYDSNDNEITSVDTDVSQIGSVSNETFTTSYQYDNHNRLTIATDNCGNTRDSAYDSRGNLADATDAKYDNTLGCPHTNNSPGNSTQYLYDGLSRRLETSQDLRVGGVGSGVIDTSNSFESSGHIVTSTTYDADSRVVTLTDNNSNTTRYVYDALNRKTSETLADGTTTSYGWDADSDLVTTTDNNGTVSNNTYDAIDRLMQTSITPAAGVIGTTLNTYQYDGLNRVTQMTDNNNPSDNTSASTVSFAYDSLSRVVEENQNATHAVDSAWYAQAQRTALTYPNNRQVDFTYDSLERIATIKDDGASSNIAQYFYIGRQRVLQRLYQNGTQLTYLDNSASTDIGYDGDRRTVERRDLGSGNSLLVGFTYNYDREDNKSYEEKLHKESNSELYNYDSTYRITGFARGQLSGIPTAPSIPSPSETEGWTLDGVYNWRVNTVNGNPQNRSVNSVNEYTSVNAGALIYDRNGNLVNDGTLGYQYDYRNRLRQVCALHSAANCTGAGAVLLATYSYDAMNRRTRKVVTNSGSFNGTTNFYYDGWRTIEERNASDTETQQYVYGVYEDEPLTLDPASGPRLFYHQNALYSTFALTNLSGSVAEGYQYEPYGQQTVLMPDFTTPIGTVSAVGNPYMFTGQRFDPETGLMYYKNRYYSLSLGRFISRDPLGYTQENLRESVNMPWTLDLYVYGLDNPTRMLDSLGTSAGH